MIYDERTSRLVVDKAKQFIIASKSARSCYRPGAKPPRAPDMTTKPSPLRPRVVDAETRLIEHEPYYEPVADEIALFEAAHQSRISALLKGPTGCGKTRFIEHMAWRLGRPLVTVSCHEDMTASDLVGRYLITNDETVWVDGP